MDIPPLFPDSVQSRSVGSRLLPLFSNSRLKVWLRRGVVLLVLMAAVFVEVHTSLIQSWIFTRTNESLSFNLEPGRSPQIAFPRSAPVDDRRGYSKLPQLLSRIEAQGYRTTHQSQQSEMTIKLINRGISPPYLEPPDAGIEIRGADGSSLFRYAQSDFLFEKIDDIPTLLVQTLLFLENRDLDRPSAPWQNPVIEWDRLLKAGLLYLGSKLYLPISVQGGSTLAVQLEKFRHSPNGRTDTPLEKFRQVVGASLKAYREGKNTKAWRERIIIDYFNTVPLAAAPLYGEIHGLGEGLYAWFGMQLAEVVSALKEPGLSPAKVRAFKHVLALLISVRAPSSYLIEERASLEEKVAQFTRLMARAGIIDWELAAALQQTPIEFLPSAPLPPQPSSGKNKAANAIRVTMMDYLGINNLYDLDRLHLEVRSTIDVPLQKKITDFLHSLGDPQVVSARGLNGERLLENSDPAKVVYSFLLVETTPNGNLVRVQADNLAAPLDFNKSVKLELGSTAKLRTLTHYLEIIAALYHELAPLSDTERNAKVAKTRDPLTRWASETLQREKKITLAAFLEQAMERRYSASPYEAFFTGGGLHQFENFDPEDNKKILPLREAFRRSTNLVFIRLMRDLVHYHRARLGFSAEEVLADPNHPQRKRLLQEIADEESRTVLRRAYQSYRGYGEQQILSRLLGSKGNTEKRLAIVFFALGIGADEQGLARWLAENQVSSAPEGVAKLFRAYHNRRLKLADYAYLLSIHPLELWCASELRKNPNAAWENLWTSSGEVRRLSSAWLLNPKNHRAQELRLRIRMEKEAFARMTPFWQRLGFPFKTMVPSLATSIGNSSDRPIALAELVGILLNDGVRRKSTSLTEIHFARGTPYESVLERIPEKGERLLAPEVAWTVRKAMAEVVEQGTARRLAGVFKLSSGKVITVGGKTGSGDNRFGTFNRYGGVITSHATNRTATFVFYIGDRYYGVVTAYVEGREAENYSFTSALPVTILKLLAPTIIARLEMPAEALPASPAEKIRRKDTTQKINFTITQNPS